MINFYLIETPKVGLYYTCAATTYEGAVKIFEGIGFKLNEWNVVHSCNSLIKHRRICMGLNIQRTNILHPSHITARRINF
jgi:hypothetical protein